MKTKKGHLKRGKILAAAAKVFAEKGYSQTTLTDIAVEANTFAGSLYYYFPGKENIVEEVLNIGTTSVSSLVIGKIALLPPDTPVIDKIKIALRTHMEQMLQRDEFVRAYWRMIDQVPEEIRQRHIVLPRAYGRFWQELLTEAQASGVIEKGLDAKLHVLFLIGSTIYALDWFNPDGRMTASQLADLLADMFLLGVVPRKKEKVANVLNGVGDLSEPDTAKGPTAKVAVAPRKKVAASSKGL